MLNASAESKPEPGQQDACRVRAVVEIPVSTCNSPGSFFSFDNLSDDKEHLAIGLGAWRTTEVPLVRIHSECLTGDVFRSQRCDCGDQLAEGMKLIEEEGGYLLYLRQEGRGIGLYNKMDAYNLQSGGLNTFEANRALGFEDDLRTYAVAAEMLMALGHRKVRLLSNNPQKERQLVEHSIEVTERLRTGVHSNVHNNDYLACKAAFGGHDINCGTDEGGFVI